MYVELTDHVKQQRAKRKPEKNDYWMTSIFEEMLECYYNKTDCHGFPVRRYPDFGRYGPCFKLICGKYGFVYSKLGRREYKLITFLTRTYGLRINGKHYNTNN